ncbi:MAG: succinate dehydrogenase, cytochrome b556 subunit [Ahrensia sp.]|nr:succinate dehydrogenase, cytochrome b556 subunit [Ahrensia sp.]
MSSTTSQSKSKRPLSPHLSIYKPIPTMVMSIFHRMTGVALYVGTLLVAWWLIAAATSESHFNFVNGFFASWFGLVVLFGYTWALMHHLLGGIRHFIWDTGSMMEKHTSTKLAYATMVGSVTLTVLVWAVGLIVT